MTACKHCGDAIDAKTQIHWAEDRNHHGLCCDCTDLSYGMPLAAINAERTAKGRPPIFFRPTPRRGGD